MRRSQKEYTKGKVERVFYLLDRIKGDLAEVRGTLITQGFQDVGKDHKAENVEEVYSSRLKAICRLRHNGLTLEQIGNLFGLTRQRVHQIIQEGTPGENDS